MVRPAKTTKDFKGVDISLTSDDDDFGRVAIGGMLQSWR